MAETPRKWRLTTIGGVVLAGAGCALAVGYFRPLDAYLLRSLERESATVADQNVEVYLERIAALGERSLPTLVAALHSERQIIAQTAATVLQRKLGELELRSTDESSRIVAGLARELAERSNRPGPHSGPTSAQLATRFLLWPIDRESIDAERLVADCELIIRSAKRSPRGDIAEQADERLSQILTPVAGSGFSVQLTDAPQLPPQTTRDLTESLTAPTTEPQDFVPVQASRVLDSLPSLAADEAATQKSTPPLDVDSKRSLDLGRDAASAPPEATARPNLSGLADLEVMHRLVGDDESQTREAVDELHRRGFQTKYVRLAELLVDPDANVRLQLVRSLPQISGVDSRPWLLWLSRDQDPAVRKAAVTVIATSSDPALQQRVRELEREETDDEVLRVVRQISNSQQSNAVR